MDAMGAGLVCMVLLLFAIYASIAYVFSSAVIHGRTLTLAEDRIRMAPIVDRLDLPEPDEIVIPSGEVNLAGSFYKNGLDGRCAVLLLHGHTGTRASSLQYVPLFWSRGCSALAYDARGHGDSTTAAHTYGYHEKDDALVAFEWLLHRTGLPSDRVGIVGVSYGAATALQMAPKLPPDVPFLIADSSYQDMRSVIAYQARKRRGSWTRAFLPAAMRLAEWRARFKAADVSPLEAVSRADIPILLVHAKDDAFTTANHSEAVYARSNHSTTELHITDWGAEHGRSIIKNYDGYRQLTDAFLETHAPRFGCKGGC